MEGEQPGFIRADQVVRTHQKRLVSVGPDAVPVALLPEIHGGVLVAQDGMDDFAGFSRQFRQRRGEGVEMLHRGERNGNARHAADARAPDSRADQHVVRGNAAPVGIYPPHRAVGDLDTGDSGFTVKRGAGFRRARHCFAGAYGFGDAVGGNIVRAMNPIRIEQREPGSGLFRRHEVGFQLPGPGGAQFAFQVFQTFGRVSDFEAPDRIITGLAVQVQRVVQRNRLSRQAGHHL